MVFRLKARLICTPLFVRVQPLERDREIIAWWEMRRIPFNLIVGSAGVVSSVIMLATGFVTERFAGEAIGIPNPPGFALIAAIAYGAMANVCFTGGWILELISRRVWEKRTEAFGEIAFAWGTLCSIVLTLIPAALTVAFGSFKLLERSFRQ